MDLNEFLSKAIEYVIASVPQLIMVISTILVYLKKVRITTDSLPVQVDKLGASIGKSIDNFEKSVVAIYKETKDNVQDIVKNAIAEIDHKVNDNLAAMQKEISGYKVALNSVREVTTLSVKENAMFRKILIELIGGDYEKIKAGIAEKIINNLVLTREELSLLGNNLTLNLSILEKSIIEYINIIGYVELDKILAGVGYERKENQEEKL